MTARRVGSPLPAGTLRTGALLISLLVLTGCGDDGGGPITPRSLPECDLEPAFLADGGVSRDGIPSLTDPTMRRAESPGTFDFVGDTTRVVGFVLNGQAYAVPHNILWWHEIVNLNIDGRQLTITLCPLTGTSLGFDRASVGGDEFGVSGLLYKANLIMFNRGDPESLWPQMLGEARCGAEVGRTIERFPVVETQWKEWRAIHPASLTVTRETGHESCAGFICYTNYPYGDYESLGNGTFLGFPVPSADRRRPAKERVLGVPPADGEPGIAFPFLALEEREGRYAVVEFDWQGEPAVLLWSDFGRGAMAYRPRTEDGTKVELSGGDEITDAATGSRWNIDGRAANGEMSGRALVPITSAYTAFWGAWANFFPDTELWEG